MDTDMLHEGNLSPQTKQTPSPTLSQEHATIGSLPRSSRAQTPAPPACSPFTPTLENVDYSAVSKMETDAHDDTALKDTSELKNFKADCTDSALSVDGASAHSPPQKFTTNGERTPTTPIVSLESIHPPHRDHSSTLELEYGGGRSEANHIAQFERDTMRSRPRARESAERDLRQQSPKRAFAKECEEQAQCAQGQVLEDEGQDILGEVPTQPNQASSAARGNSGPDATTPEVSHAPWVKEAVGAVKRNKKNPLNDGDILVIFDTKDLQKSCLIRSRDIAKVSDTLKELCPNTEDVSNGCSSIPSAALVLCDLEPMPRLVVRPLDEPLETIHSTLASEERKTRSRSAENARIKSESAQEEDASESDPVDSGTNWPKAYDSFLRIVAGKRAQGLSKSDPATALPHIEAIVQVAQRYDAVHAVQGVFDSLFFEYVGNGTFWELIEEEPARCLNIAITLQKQHVYEEAFKHLVGRSANYEAGQQFDNLPGDVLAIIRRRSSELFNLRRKINEDLLLISLPAPKRKKGALTPKHQSSVVNQQDHYAAYCTVITFRDWICDHVAHLRNETSQPPSEEFPLCDHSNGCYTVAGFYRLLTAGGDAYLPADEVWKHANSAFIGHDERSYSNASRNDLETVKNSLESLKNKASEVAASLVQSELHLPGKDELDYLTCIKVKAEDVPWAIACEDQEDDEDEDMDDD